MIKSRLLHCATLLLVLSSVGQAFASDEMPTTETPVDAVARKSVVAAAASPSVETVQTTTDFSLPSGIPRLQVRSPIYEPQLKLYQFLPKKLFFYGSVENAYRYESNPFQASDGTYGVYKNDADSYRFQGDATLGYAFTPKTKLSVSYLNMVNVYDNFGPARLDSTAHSVSATLDQVIFSKAAWTLKGSLTARQTISSTSRQSGDILPALTLIRGLGNHGWAFANASLNMGRRSFAIGDDLDSISPIITLGTGYTVPWDGEKAWQKILRGVTFNLSSTYILGGNLNSSPFRPSNPQSLIVSAEVSRPLARRSPLTAFFRVEPTFNFGDTNDGVIGYGDVNWRLMGGLRFAVGKSPVFTSPLD